jgi:DNA-binding response OmpR family regulator
MCKRILVLDDDIAILDALNDVLEYSGYTVSTLSSADVLFERIQEFKPDLILLDVMLAEQDGREICRRIKQSLGISNIPVILISATHNLSQCLTPNGGPDDFVAKPFDIDTLLHKIEHQFAA